MISPPTTLKLLHEKAGKLIKNYDLLKNLFLKQTKETIETIKKGRIKIIQNMFIVHLRAFVIKFNLCSPRSV